VRRFVACVLQRKSADQSFARRIACAERIERAH
jgi:hypothetical protein